MTCGFAPTRIGNMSIRDKAEIVSILVGILAGGFFGFLLGRAKVWTRMAEESAKRALLSERLRLKGLVR